MLEWMIAITAVCGAISGLSILYLALRAGLKARSNAWAARRTAALLADDSGAAGGDAGLPRAHVHRVSPTLGVRRGRRLASLRRDA